ncbi:MAG TPA: hypothetical protein VF731_01770 [Solirubrobacterales bacterium]
MAARSPRWADPAPEGAYYAATGPLLSGAADALADAGAALDEAARALRRAAAVSVGTATSPEAAPLLRGSELRRAIEDLAARVSDREPVHYRDLFALLERAGFRVGGRDPVATFLTQLSRSQRFQPVGRRSGLYRVAR